MNRRQQAETIYKRGLENVANNPEPKKQKFPIGTRVFITKDIEPEMKHFRHGCKATVLYTYAHAYPQFNDKETEKYCLHIDGAGSSAWYLEHQLTAIKGIKEVKEDLKKIIAETKKEIEEWGERRGVKLKAPYPGDSPCYYCESKLLISGIDKCDFCIHNADNILIELLEV